MQEMQLKLEGLGVRVQCNYRGCTGRIEKADSIRCRDLEVRVYLGSKDSSSESGRSVNAHEKNFSFFFKSVVCRL